jgi:hypothetical protein
MSVGMAFLSALALAVPQQFAEKYAEQYINSYPPPETPEETHELNNIKANLIDAMMAMNNEISHNKDPSSSDRVFAKNYANEYINVTFHIGSDEEQEEQIEELRKSMINAMMEMSIYESHLSSSQPTKITEKSLTAPKRYEESPYTLWVKEWREKHSNKNPPTGEWDRQTKADPTLKDYFQRLADKINENIDIENTKNIRFHHQQPSGYTLMQMRLRELNAHLPKGINKIKCSDPEFKVCKVNGMDGKVSAEGSIANLEKLFYEKYGILD